jgi:integrase
MAGERLYKRGKIWWGWYYDADRKRVSKSTRCRDQRAAEAVVREWERAAADPTYAAANATTLREALERFLIDRTNKGRAEGTLSSYRVKVGHLLRLLGGDSRVARLDARMVDGYVDTRLEEGASRHTVQKELVALRGTLKVAKRRGDFSSDIGAVMPEGFSAGYKPRVRFLSGPEAQRLLAELTPDRAARVAFILATGARWSESERAMRDDIDWQLEIVHLRGTKTESAARAVPIVGASYDLLAHAVQYAEGVGGLLFRPWGNCRRDLNEACTRAATTALMAHLQTTGQTLDALSSAEQTALKARFAFAPVSPNDLRRTYATWLRQHGTEPHLIGVALGHTDSRMAERVYGRMPVESLGRMLADRVGDRSAFVANTAGAQRSGRQVRRPDRAKTPVNVVPRDRIELPTRGFSILCSTD